MTRHYRDTFWAILAAVALASAAIAQQQGDPFAEVLRYTIDQPRTAPAAAEAAIRAAKPEELPAIEARLLDILASPAATRDAKDWACRQLRQVGSERSVAALAPLVADKDLATAARWALQSIPGPKVDEALRDALGKVQGDLKVGVICTLGARGDRQAVPLLAPLASDSDPAVAEAALYALGHVGGSDALRAVQAATVPDALKRYRLDAVLLAAERMPADGQRSEAAKVCRDVFAQSDDPVIQAAALRGALVNDPPQATPLVAAALKAESVKLRLSAAKFACELGAPDVLGPVLAELPSLPVDVQTIILGMVADKAALPAALKAVESGEEDVRLAALGALGRVGDVSVVPKLLAIAGAGGGNEQAAARESLAKLRGDDIDPALIAAAQKGETPLRVEAIRALAARSAWVALSKYLELAKDADPAVRTQAVAALGTMGRLCELGRMLKLLAPDMPEDERAGIEKAAIAIVQRVTPHYLNIAAGMVLNVMPGQPAEVRSSVVRVLARIPSAKALDGLRTLLGDPEASVKDAAVRGLAQWPDAAPMEDLLGIARSDASQVHKVLALRGLVRMAGLPSGRPVPETVKLLAEAMALAPRPEEKKLALGALAQIKHPAALDLAASFLSDKDLEVEAATAVVRIAKQIQTTDAARAAAAVRKVLDVCKTPAARQLAEGAMIVLDNMVNVAPQGTATSPDDLEKDGQAGGDQAAIDGDPGTYWDEQDGKDLYRLVVTFRGPQRIAAVSIQGYGQQNFAPRDFEILCDGKAVKKIENAQYEENLLIVSLEPATCTTVELKITGYYGSSPAVRELGIYTPEPTK